MTPSHGAPAGRGGSAGAGAGEHVPLHERDWAWRNALRSMPVVGPFYKVLVGVVGLFVVVLGLILVPFPGPGWAIVFLGVLLWATEFPPASRLLHWGRLQLGRFTHWVARRGWPARIGLGVLTAVTCTVIVWCVLWLIGPPPGLPASWEDLLLRWGHLPGEPVWAR